MTVVVAAVLPEIQISTNLVPSNFIFSMHEPYDHTIHIILNLIEYPISIQSTSVKMLLTTTTQQTTD